LLLPLALEQPLSLPHLEQAAATQELAQPSAVPVAAAVVAAVAAVAAAAAVVVAAAAGHLLPPAQHPPPWFEHRHHSPYRYRCPGASPSCCACASHRRPPPCACAASCACSARRAPPSRHPQLRGAIDFRDHCSGCGSDGGAGRGCRCGSGCGGAHRADRIHHDRDRGLGGRGSRGRVRAGQSCRRGAEAIPSVGCGCDCHFASGRRHRHHAAAAADPSTGPTQSASGVVRTVLLALDPRARSENSEAISPTTSP